MFCFKLGELIYGYIRHYLKYMLILILRLNSYLSNESYTLYLSSSVNHRSKLTLSQHKCFSNNSMLFMYPEIYTLLPVLHCQRSQARDHLPLKLNKTASAKRCFKILTINHAASYYLFLQSESFLLATTTFFC